MLICEKNRERLEKKYNIKNGNKLQQFDTNAVLRQNTTLSNNSASHIPLLSPIDVASTNKSSYLSNHEMNISQDDDGYNPHYDNDPPLDAVFEGSPIFQNNEQHIHIKTMSYLFIINNIVDGKKKLVPCYIIKDPLLVIKRNFLLLLVFQIF